jgi:hypothetical protein
MLIFKMYSSIKESFEGASTKKISTFTTKNKSIATKTTTQQEVGAQANMETSLPQIAHKNNKRATRGMFKYLLIQLNSSRFLMPFSHVSNNKLKNNRSFSTKGWR